ncbi:FAD-dependent oxidoreductase [Nonomuraea turkmeniaca]|uniref:FAD-dependent oxidoreductase n=1 Tax=Nonomuraea turkmeniaca TaxID=103838 RepID=UPI003CCC8133
MPATAPSPRSPTPTATAGSCRRSPNDCPAADQRHPRDTATTPDGGIVHLRAQHAVAVCAGSAAALPDLPGSPPCAPGPAATPPALPTARTTHHRRLIVGAGVVATEMATPWQVLGTEVTLLARGSRLLPDGTLRRAHRGTRSSSPPAARPAPATSATRPSA